MDMHNFDQALAATKDLAIMVDKMFDECRKNGMKREEALEVAIWYMYIISGGSQQ